MKKVEIITKNNGNKKKHVIKIKSKSDLAAVLGFANYYMVKDHLPDIDLKSTVSFKIDNEKVSLNKLRDELKKEIRKETVLKDRIIDQERDENGRIVIHSRKSITFSSPKKNNIDGKKKSISVVDIKKKKKKNKKDKSKKKKKKNRL